MHIARIGLMVAAALLAAPVMAQQTRSAAEIVLAQAPAQSGHRILGDVRAEIHQKSLMAKTPARELADRELRAQAARLGADAVVDIKYENNSPMFSKKGFIAVGKAVKFETALAAAAPVVAPPVAAPVRAAPATAPVATPPVTAAAPVTTLATSAAPVPAMIAIIEGPSPRASRVMGDVRAEIHQKSLFPKTPSRELAEQELRTKAAKLGADAVVDVKYENNSAMMSKKGFIATGKAVKFDSAVAAAPVAPVATPPVAIPVAPPAPVIVQPTPQLAPAAPPVVAAAPIPAPQVSAPAVRPAAAPAMIVLTEDNLAGRAVTVLGVIEAEAHQTSLFPKKTARDMLEESLRAKAAALGADAVISIKYDMNSPMMSKKGSRATGVAVKFQ